MFQTVHMTDREVIVHGAALYYKRSLLPRAILDVLTLVQTHPQLVNPQTRVISMHRKWQFASRTAPPRVHRGFRLSFPKKRRVQVWLVVPVHPMCS